MDLGTLAMLASMLFGAIVSDAILFGKTMRVEFTVPKVVAEQGFTQDVAERLFISEFGRLADISFILPFPTISQASQDSLLSIVAKPLRIDPIAELVQRKIGSDVVSIQNTMVNAGGATKFDIYSVVTDAGGSVSRHVMTGASDAPAKLVEGMARRIASDTLPYRVAMSDYVIGLHGDPKGFEMAKQLAEHALGTGFDRSKATQRVMLYNVLGLLKVRENDPAAAEQIWAEAMQVPFAKGASYSIVAANRAFIAISQRDFRHAREMHGIALANKVRPYLDYYDDHLKFLDALISWGEGNTQAAEGQFAVLEKALIGDTAPTYLATLLSAQGRTEEAKAATARATFMKTVKTQHPDLVGSVYWVDPVKGGFKRRT